MDLDLQVTRRALKDGQTQNDISLILSADRAMGRRIIQDQGMQPTMLCLNQTVRKIISCQTVRKPRSHQVKRVRQIELE